MEQKEFSKLILKFLEENYPEFTNTLKYLNDGSFDCDLKSESGIFSIWIATYGSEITIGIEDPNGKTDIHTHISCYELENLENCLFELSSIIEEIKADKLILYQTNDGSYNWIKTVEINNLYQLTKKFSWKKNNNVT